MITKEKLALNLKELKSILPIKPKVYTSEHPKNIAEALIYYCNQRTINGVQACTKYLNGENWPLPLWFNPLNVKVGFWNNIYYRKQYNSWKKGSRFKGLKGFDFFWVPVMNHYSYNLTCDEILLEAFGANLKYAFKKLLQHSVLQTKKPIIESIRKTFKKGDWVACISTLFPLLDFVARRILKTRNLRNDVSKICKLFEQNGFSLDTADHLMPHFAFVSSHEPGQHFLSKEREDWFNKMLEFDFGLIGPPLSSFIRFANIYYSYYKEESEDDEEDITLLNRHAILHGSINHFGSKVNTIKLITFLYLILELEPVFEILFAE